MGVSKHMPWVDRYAHPCAWDLDFPPLALTDMFTASAAAHAECPAVRFMGRDYSYRAMLAEARAFAAGLQEHGIKPGDRVGLFLPNVPIYVAAYYGAMMVGAVVVNFSPLYTVDELAVQVGDSGTRLLVTVDVPALLPTALKVLAESPLETLVVGRLADMLPWYKGLALRLFGRRQTTPVPGTAGVITWNNLLRPGQSPRPVPVDPETTLALLQYTGGTTGTPKGAMLTHQNLSANARQLQAIDSHAGDRDVVLGILPLFHVFANTCVLNRTVLNGGCIVMLPRFDAGQALAAINAEKPTSIFVVPTMLQALLDNPRIDGTDFSSVRGIISGGAALSGPLLTRFVTATGVRVVEGYGLTESSGVISTSPLYEGDYGGTIGQVVPGTHLRLLDKEDAGQDAVPGEPGELAVRGPQVMRGYWNRPEAAIAAFATRDDGLWLRTGDVGVIDADGFITIVDRSKDMIAVGGFKVFPSQVEHVLLQHPAVKEALVIGVKDEYRGEVPRAYVTLAGEATADQLRDWLNTRVGKHERVDAVVLRDSLPKTMIGKLDRKALRAEVL
jgi:long-chain acyl-CoA synthetase